MEQLFKDFNGVDTNLWKQQLEKDLKGISFDELTKKDTNGLSILPFYTQDDIANLSTSQSVFNHTNWDIIQYIKVNDAVAANVTALNLLNDGVSGLFFEVNAAVDLAKLLAGVQVPFIALTFKVVDAVDEFNVAWNNYASANNYDTSIAIIISEQQHFNNSSIVIDGSSYNNRGANSVTELAAIIGQLQDSLHDLEAKDQLKAVKSIYLQLAVDTAFYEQIAKLRALRILVHQVLKAYGLQPQVYIHTVTAHVYRSHVDMHSNMLRDTLSAMAGVLGGANGVTVFPYDYYVQEASSFSHRMAKNIQLLLREEAYLHLVGDVSNGSFYLESLTHQLVDSAWAIFLDVESKGGLSANLDFINQMIQDQAQQLVQAYKDGKKILIGVNKHKNNMETNTPNFNAAQVAIPSNYINIAQVLF